MIPEGLSFDIANPKYRQFKSGENILEYPLEGGEITVDWVSGTNASSMMRSILDAEGAGVTRISGYVTDSWVARQMQRCNGLAIKWRGKSVEVGRRPSK